MGSGAADLEATTPTKASPAQARDPSQPSDKQAHPGESTPPRGPETHTAPNKTSQDQGARPRQGRQARQDRKQKRNDQSKADKSKPSKAEQRKNERPSPSKTRRTRPRQANARQGEGNSLGQSQSELICQCSIPSETSKTGRAAVVSARPRHTPEAPST